MSLGGFRIPHVSERFIVFKMLAQLRQGQAALLLILAGTASWTWPSEGGPSGVMLEGQLSEWTPGQSCKLRGRWSSTCEMALVLIFRERKSHAWNGASSYGNL